MTSPSVCSRRNIAAFCNVCKYALPRSQRFIHSLAPLQAKTAPAVRRKARQDAPVAWFIADRLGPSEDPLSDVEVQKLIAQLQVNMPHVLGAYEYVLRRSMDRPMIHRIMLFDERILPILGRELAWSEDVQKIFDSYRKYYDVSVGHIHEGARVFVRTKLSPPVARANILLLQCCARSGYEEAALDMGAAYIDVPGSKGDSSARRAYTQAKEEIQRLAIGGSLRAASLYAELVEADVGPKAALAHWETAVQIAVEQTESHKTGSDRFAYLERPWIRLAAIKSSHAKDPAGAEAALRTGMLKDDPDAYYLFARLNDGDSLRDPAKFMEWMNAVTKSAASGSFRSAIDLGRHYANDPFMDLSSLGVPDTSGSLWSDTTSLLKSFFSRQPDSAINDYRTQVAAYANFARSSRDRMHLAIKWLEIAAEQGSISAVIDLAILRSRRFLFPARNLDLAIKHPDDQKDTDIREVLDDPEALLFEAEEIPKEPFSSISNPSTEFVWRRGAINPFFSLDKVRQHLGVVAEFGAWRGMFEQRDRVKEYEGEVTMRDKSDLAPMFYRFPDLAKMNEENWKEDWQASKDIADELGVDICLPGGEVAHKHRPRVHSQAEPST